MLFDARTDEPADLAALPLTELIRLPFESFLSEFVRRHPEESRMVLGEADVSPESVAAGRHAESWAYKLFAAADITDHREFDRAALGLKYLHAALTGDRAAFPISDANYARIRAWLDRSIADETALQAWCWALLFNDLGKLKAVARAYEAIHGQPCADHDQVLVGVLRASGSATGSAAQFPTLWTLGPVYERALIDGLATGFNLGKAAQLECPDAAWDAVRALDPAAANFHFGHSFFDFLGVTGAVNPTAALPVILNDANVEAYLGVIETLDVAAYRARRLALAGFDAAAPDAAALGRLVGMARVFDAAGGARLRAATAALPEAVRAILTAELGVSGHDGVTAVEPHYGPALLANADKADPQSGWTRALLVMARALHQARRAVGPGAGGVAIANLGDLATAIAKDGLGAVEAADLTLAPTSDGVRVGLAARPRLDAAAFPARAAADWLRGQRAAFVGIGGGSDCLQAAQAAFESGADVACVVSVRTAALTGASGGAVGAARSVEKHGGEIAPGVFRILPESSGAGRFLENLPADRVAVYLVLDAEDGTLPAQIDAVLAAAGRPEVLVAVDTGGDALYRSAVSDDLAKATPDQDLRVLEALGALTGVAVVTLELAVGVDSPEYAAEVLGAAGAERVTFDAAAAERVLARYAAWRQRVPGGWIGKTPLAWMAALLGVEGLAVLDIPAARVTDLRNPWNPFVHVGAAMAGGFTMPLARHLAAIG